MGFIQSLIDAISGTVKCPACGTRGAKKRGDSIRCLNPVCRFFSPQATPEARAARAQIRAAEAKQPRPSYQPSGDTVSIRYRNFRDESKTFTADRASLERRHNHLVARIAPSWRKVSLSRDRIENLSEIDTHLPERDRSGAPQPTGRERQVLGYHKKYGTTSPLYEKIRAKYPNW
jgi:hypothetical protein